MRYLLRKTMTMLCVFAMLFSVCSAEGFGNVTVAETVEYDPDVIELLSALNIIDEFDSESAAIYLGEAVTRAEMAVALVKFTNSDSFIAGDNSFKDVVPGAFEEPYIYTAVDMKLMAPVAEGYFYPGYPVKYAEAAQALVMSLGYTSLAQQDNSWLIRAKRLDLLNGVPDEGNFTRNDMYRMLYNALHAEVMYITAVSGNNISHAVSEGYDALRYYFDVMHEEGVINAAGGVELGKGLINDTDCIKINGKLMPFKRHNMKDYLGRNSVVYYTADNDVICIADNNNEVLVLDAGDLDDYKNLVYTYVDGEKEKKVKLEEPYVILNGEEYLGSYTKTVMVPDSGSVTLIDNNHNSAYDVVIIDSYKDYYVKYTTLEPDSLTDNYGNTVNADLESYIVKVYGSDGTELEFSSIAEGMVATVAQSNEKISIRLSEEEIDGKLNGMKTTAGHTVWNISGEEYMLSKSLVEGLQNGQIEAPDSLMNCTFKLNIFGEIVYYEEIVKQVGASRFYAIVTGAALSEPFGDGLRLNLFSKELGGFKVVEAAKKVKLNGTASDYSTVYNALRRNGLNGDSLTSGESGIWAQPVRVELNENDELIYLAQASTKDDGTEADFSYYMGTYNKTSAVKAYREIIQFGYKPAESDIKFSEAPYISCDGRGTYWKHIGTGRSHHTVIQVPFGADGRIVGTSEDLFAARSLPGGTENKLIVYRIGDALEADLILVAVDDIKSEHCKNTFNIRCVTSITTEWVDEMPVQSIKTDKDTYYNTNSIDLSNLVLYNLGGNPQTDENGNIKTYSIKPGDLVNVLADAKNNIVAIEAVYDHENKKLLGDATVKNGTQALYCDISDHEWWQRNEAGTSNEGGNLIMVDIMRREGSYFVGCLAKAEEFDKDTHKLFMSLTPPTCVLVQKDRHGNVTTGPAALNDYVAYDYAPGNHSTIVMGMGWTTFNGTSFLYEHE